MLKLNQINRDVFSATGVTDSCVKLNANGSIKNISRKEIIATGRLVACEYFGSLYNKMPNVIEKYNSRLGGKNIRYDDLARAHKEKKLLFCAAKVDQLSGRETPNTFEEFKKNSLIYANDPMFLKVMAQIDQEVLQPIFFDVIDSVGMGLMQWEASPLGATKEITVNSNDVFLFEDSAFGSQRSTSKNYLYAKTITLTPKVFACNATIKWYQDMVNGDAGRYYAAIMNGMYSKIYAKMLRLLKAAIAGGKYIPAGLTADTYTTQNWITITDKLAASCGVRVSDLMAIGTRSALSNVLPVDGTGGAILGMQYGLGEEWFENGFLPKAANVDLFPVTPSIVPGTQNTTIDTLDTGNNIYIMAKGGMGYKPMVGVYAEGSPVILTANPMGANGAQGTADMTIDINVSAYFDIKPVFASKVAVITSVYPTASI